MISHFTPRFLQNKLNGMQLLMYVLFIPIVWFTFQYNLMHYASFFQELYWVLALGVSLCPTLLYIVIKAGLLDLTTILSRRKNCKNYISIYMFQCKNFVLCWFVFHTMVFSNQIFFECFVPNIRLLLEIRTSSVADFNYLFVVCWWYISWLAFDWFSILLF